MGPSLLETVDAPGRLEEHYRRIHRYVLGLIHDPAEADDLTQETFLRAHRRRDSLRDTGALTAWLYRIATHVCMDRLRLRARRPSLESGVDHGLEDLVDAHASSLEQTTEQDEMSACVQRYLGDLPDSYRMVILLHDEQGLTTPETAEILGVSVPTVKIRLHRARRKMQAALEAGCTFSRDDRGVFVCESRP